MADSPVLPFSDTYWVVPGKLMAGEYPGVHNLEYSRKRIIALIRSGIRTIIDLTQPGDSDHPYAQHLSQEAELHGVEIKRLNFPVPDFGTPPAGLMTRILNLIEDEIAEGKPIYVHCLAGIGRTGTVVGCYLVNQGLTGEEALAEITNLRANTSSWWHRSPENQDQVDFILNWAVRKASDKIYS
ncbi:MAG TPA: dual specificity protein phosphatase family protein [Anaerolineaceae bacterium]|nr:dual specificity protein phosphatase family protein [Anaerolineaceae bacterium]